MDFNYNKQFLKDLASLPLPYKKRIENIVFEELPLYDHDSLFRKLLRIKGHDGFYIIRVGIYRIALCIISDKLEFIRVFHREGFSIKNDS